jgi:tetratricopeptide (TPR) repeat protein
MKNLFGFIFGLLLMVNGYSQAHDSLLQQANQAYQKEAYDSAIMLYQRLIDDQLVSADLYYNLGNAYYKNREIASAILYYEKALKWDPNHEDARHNLQLANQKTVDKIESIPELFLYRWWKSIFNLFNASQWAGLTVLLFFLMAVGFGIYFLGSSVSMRKAGFVMALISLGAGIFCWFLANRQHTYLEAERYGVIMAPTVNINSSPSSGSSRLFVLHEGTRVRLEEQTEGWYEISLPNGNTGWIKTEQVKGI